MLERIKRQNAGEEDLPPIAFATLPTSQSPENPKKAKLSPQEELTEDGFLDLEGGEEEAEGFLDDQDLTVEDNAIEKDGDEELDIEDEVDEIGEEDEYESDEVDDDDDDDDDNDEAVDVIDAYLGGGLLPIDTHTQGGDFLSASPSFTALLQALCPLFPLYTLQEGKKARRPDLFNGMANRTCRLYFWLFKLSSSTSGDLSNDCTPAFLQAKRILALRQWTLLTMSLSSNQEEGSRGSLDGVSDSQ